MIPPHVAATPLLPSRGVDSWLPTHVPVIPPEGGLTRPGVIGTEPLRSVSKDRLGRRHGVVARATRDRVDRILTIVLGL